MKRFYNNLKHRYWNLIHHYPYFYIRILYNKEFFGMGNKHLCLSDPKDINEKILWLEYFTDTRLWSRLADKYSVREYVRNRIGEEYLVPLLGHWGKAEDIDFDTLPKSFVIRPNNGSYDTIIVNDKNEIDVEEIRRRLSDSLKHKFGLENAEPHYLRIKPCIIAEALLKTDEPHGLTDYKIWCFGGKPYCIMVCLNRDPITHHANLIYYDLQWNRMPECLSIPFRNDESCPKPESLQKMLELATKLSTGFPQVRVDMYNVNGKIYFGEMTFTSNYGMMPYLSQEVLDDMGKHCILPRRTFSDYWQSFLTRYLPKFK